MKKLFFTAILTVAILNSYGQVTETGSKVGIGTDDPQAKLEVNGDMIVQDNATIQDYVFMYGANNTGVIRNTLNSGSMVFSGGNSTGVGANLRLGGSSGTNDLRVRIGTSEKFRISSNGSVGIGTDDPQAKLEVNGDMIVQDNATIQDYVFMYGSNNTGVIRNTLNSGSMVFSGGNSTGVGANLRLGGSLGTNDLRIRIGTSEKFRISSNGNVGIGTNTPDSKLAVNGRIHAKEVKVDLNGWSDFVFYDDYKLKTLEEVENHIDEKGHLPEMPTEEEVMQNGINLGEMDAKLLQKIEELTLYVIEQNKQNQAQQEQLEKQSVMIEQLQKEILGLKSK